MNLFSASKRVQLYFCDHIGEKDLKFGACCVRGLKVLRPRLQKLIFVLTNLRKFSNENIVDYITRAKDMQLNLSEVDESISEKMFVSILLKRL